LIGILLDAKLIPDELKVGVVRAELDFLVGARLLRVEGKGRDQRWSRALPQNEASQACLVCGMRSFHPTDIVESFCGKCHVVRSRDELWVIPGMA